jgi:hypothetical protein
MMWINPFYPHMWMYIGGRPMDVGRAPFNRISLPCGWIRDNLSTKYPQKTPQTAKIHILEKTRALVHIWGYAKSNL